VVSGFMGALSGSFAFVCSFYHLTNLFHSNMYKGENAVLDRVKLLDYRYKNVLIYAISDLSASVLKAPFEVRKQLIQMYSKDVAANQIAKLVSITWIPLVMRDVTFRTMMLSFYYLTTDIEHKPHLKYTIP
jgi:hypothetical protein